MAQSYFSLVTTAGKIKLAQSAAGGSPVVITHFAVGDGNGAETNPTAASAALVHEVWRTPVESVTTDPDNPAAILVTAIIPTNAGGWWMREFGIFANDGTMVAVARPVSQYKPTALEGQLEDIRYEFQIIIGENANVTLLVDPSLVFATRAWIENRKVPMGQLMRLPWFPILSMTLSSAPGNPAIGDTYLIPSNASGVWATNIGKIGEWNGAGWNYISPPDGHGISLPDGRVFERVGGAYVEKLALDVQSGRWTFAAAAGSVNALAVTLSPAPAALFVGMEVRALVAGLNTGPVTLNVNGLGAKTVVNQIGGDLVGGEMIGVVDFVYDGAKFWANVTRPALSADRSYYVNAATGSDSNSGLSAGSAFATIQKAVDVASSLNLNGFTATIAVANGTYANFSTPRAAAGGTITIVGNNAAPENVVVGPVAAKPGIGIFHSGYSVSGFSPRGASGQHNLAVSGTSVNVGSLHHAGVTGGAHIASGAGGTIFLTGNHYIAGGASVGHLYAADGGSIRSAASQPTVTFTATALGFGAFVVATNGNINVSYSSITAGGNAIGPRYNATMNGVINTNGGGENYYPGNAVGTRSTGGQYG